MAGKYTRKELETHNTKSDALFVIDNVVYDVTGFLEDHPGGVEVLLDNAGRDASQCFHDVGHSEDAHQLMQQYAVGEVVEADRLEVRRRFEGGGFSQEPLTLSGLISVWGTPVGLALLAFLLYYYLF